MALDIQALASYEFDEGAIRSQLMDNIREKESSYPEGNLTFYLRELQKDENGAIIRQSESSGKYFFSNPFYSAFALALFAKYKHKKQIELSLELPMSHALSESAKEKYKNILEQLANIVMRDLKI